MTTPPSDCGFAPRAFPAAERREDVTEGRQRIVARRLLLVVHHQQPLRARAELLGNLPYCLSDLILRDVVAVFALRLVGEDAGGAAARSGVRLGRFAPPPRADQEPALRAA